MTGTALITGHAGFIGFHVAQRLLAAGWKVVGVDNFNDYYDVALKHSREARLSGCSELTALKGDIHQPGLLQGLFRQHRPNVVIHLAAQAGVRASIENPRPYFDSNLAGSFELLEAARQFPPRHLMMASTSSAYGANTTFPYAETQRADWPMSFYAATKKATEVMAHGHAHIYGLPVTLFRFFTVYGPWGRPDMAPMKFTRAILEGRPIDVYNHGRMKRDFTFIDDLVDGIVALMDAPPSLPQNRTDDAPDFDSLSPVAPHRVVNIGNNQPVELMDFIAALEQALGQKAKMNFKGMQPGDVHATWADTQLLQHLTGFQPKTSVQDGVARLVRWYREHYAKASDPAAFASTGSAPTQFRSTMKG